MAEMNFREQQDQYRANARARKDQIESGKTIFLKDYQRMEKQLEKELADTGLPFGQRAALSEKLTSLKMNWQQNGVSDVNVVIAMRDSILGNLKEAGSMSLPEADLEAIFGEQRRHLTELNAIIDEAKQKGLI